MAKRMSHVCRISAIVAALGLVSSLHAAETSYVYDALGRVVEVTYGDGSQTAYSYDPAGNRTQVVRTANSQLLTPGGNIYSANNQYRLTMNGDGNVVLLGPGNSLIWATGTWSGATGLRLENGDLKVVNGQTVVWSTGTTGYAGAYLEVGNAGQVILRTSGGLVMWTSNPPVVGSLLVHNDRVTSPDGKYYLTMHGDGNVVLWGANGAAGPNNAIWYTQTYNGATSAEFVNGEFKVMNGASTIWTSNTAGNANSTIRVTNTGQVVIYANNGQELWVSNGVQYNYYLSPGLNIYSPNSAYRLTMNGDGNVVLFGPGNSVIWYTGTWNGATGVKFENGNLMVMNGTTTVWSSNTSGNAGATVAVEDTGQVVIRSSGGSVLWTSNPAQNYYLVPGQHLYSPNGTYHLTMNGDGNVVLFGAGGAVLWYSGTWNGATGMRLENGDLKIYNGTTVVWSSNTGGNPGATVAVEDSGRLVVRSSTGTILWGS